PHGDAAPLRHRRAASGPGRAGALRPRRQGPYGCRNSPRYRHPADIALSFRFQPRQTGQAMMLSSRRLALALVLAFAAALSVAPPVVALEGAPMILPVDPAPLTVETKDGERRFTVEIAADDSERSAGLMFRTEMDDVHGMLFVFERARRLSFWMKNTPMP